MSLQETRRTPSGPQENEKSPEFKLDTTHALLAPGQGHQKIGMGLELAKRSEAAAEIWRRVDTTLRPQLDFDLSDKIWNGTAEDLAENAQLAIITDALARKAALVEAGLLENPPGWHVGNSLGLITAIVNAGSLSIEGAAHLANGRKQALNSVTNEGPKTAMVSLVNVDESIVDRVKEKYNLVTCLINADKHVVIGGEVEGVKNAVSNLEDEHRLGGSNIFPLEVNAAYHSKYMEPAVPFWTEVVNSAPIEEPKSGIVVGGSTVKQLLTPDDIRNELIMQLTYTERYRDVVKYLRGQGVTQITELSEVARLTHINKEYIFLEGSRQAIAMPKANDSDKRITIGNRWVAPVAQVEATATSAQETVSRDSIKEFYFGWVANRAGIDPKEMSEDMSFTEGASLDSEDIMALRAAIRAEYRRNLSDEEAAQILTIGAGIDATHKLMNS